MAHSSGNVFTPDWRGSGGVATITPQGDVVLIGAAARPDWLLRVVDAVTAWLPAKLRAVVVGLASQFAAGLAVVREPARLAAALAWSLPLWLVIAVSWMIALPEYLLQVPANRLGHSVYTAVQLKTLQEIITLSVFVGFSIWYLGESIRWNHLAGFVLIVLAAWLIFLD